MAIEEGLGQCPVCGMKIEVGQSARYFGGAGKLAHAGAMAHTLCVTKYEARINTPEYKREQAEAKLALAEAKLAAAIAYVDHARAELKGFQ